METLYNKLGRIAEIWYSGIEIKEFDGKTLTVNAIGGHRVLLKGNPGNYLKHALKQYNIELVILNCKKSKRKSTISNILNAVCDYFEIGKQALCDPYSKESLARQISIFFMDWYGYDNTEIANVFRRDISYILYCSRKINCALQEDPEILEDVICILKSIIGSK